MILYKYMHADIAITTLKEKTLKLSRASSFNDPFEYSACLTYDRNDTCRYIGGKHDLLKDSFDQQSYLLCMTRSPLNQLMWAHYAKEHEGVVLGIDSSTDFFRKDCILPIQFGNVIYTQVKPTNDYPLPPSDEGGVFQCAKDFDPDNLECLQRVYLYKSTDWAYEEEVRLVKHRSSILSQEGKSLPPNVGPSDATGWLIKVPDLAIREVYLGARTDDTKAQEIKELLPKDVILKRCRCSSRDWRLDPDMPPGK